MVMLMMVDQVVVVLLMLVEVLLAALETELLDQIHHQHLHQIKDILVELDMVLLRITLDLVEVVVVLMLPDRMGDQLDQQ